MAPEELSSLIKLKSGYGFIVCAVYGGVLYIIGSFGASNELQTFFYF
jgi:hypothetical protein